MDTLGYYEGKKACNVFVASNCADLAQFKKENNQTAFNSLLLKTLYQVKRYITTRLSTALLLLVNARKSLEASFFNRYAL